MLKRYDYDSQSLHYNSTIMVVKGNYWGINIFNVLILNSKGKTLLFHHKINIWSKVGIERVDKGRILAELSLDLCKVIAFYHLQEYLILIQYFCWLPVALSGKLIPSESTRRENQPRLASLCLLSKFLS